MTTALNPLETVANARAALHEVVSRLTAADDDKQTPNAKFTVAQLTDHLQNSIKLLGSAAGVDIALTTEGSVADRLLPQSQAVVDAWQRRGIDGTGPCRSASTRPKSPFASSAPSFWSTPGITRLPPVRSSSRWTHSPMASWNRCG
ncbi:TIGR03086 family protein [Mycobacteroides abscessus]|nr:TIGR03086 family protein [Mycobacteroides abscessus]